MRDRNFYWTEKISYFNLLSFSRWEVAIFFDKISQVLELIYKPNIDIVVNGDFNLDPQRDYNNYNRLSDIFNSFGVFNLVSTPTRGNNILDHIYAGQVLGHIVEDNTLGDYRSVLVNINLQYPNNTYYSINKRIFSNSNINAFSNNQKQESWEGVKKCTNVNDAFNRFYEIFMFYFNSTFPLKTIKKHKNKNWVNPEIRNSSAHLKNLFKVKNKYPDLYREVKKKHSNLIRETKRKFYL